MARGRRLLEEGTVISVPFCSLPVVCPLTGKGPLVRTPCAVDGTPPWTRELALPPRDDGEASLGHSKQPGAAVPSPLERRQASETSHFVQSPDFLFVSRSVGHREVGFRAATAFCLCSASGSHPVWRFVLPPVATASEPVPLHTCPAAGPARKRDLTASARRFLNWSRSPSSTLTEEKEQQCG